MKLVYSNGYETSSKVISEKEYYDYWQNNEWTKIETKSEYESCRLEKYDQDNNRELIVIYKDNRQLRTRNTWKEQRLLRVFSKLLIEKENFPPEKAQLYHSVQYHIETNLGIYHTEIDGQLRTYPNIGIEIKGSKLKRRELEFFYQKSKLLELEHLHLFAPAFSSEVIKNVSPDITLWEYKLDSKTLENYYNYFTLPNFIRQEIGKRHLRFLTQSGKWLAPKRRVTSTSKHTTDQKIIQEIFKVKQVPVKIYYSLARVIDPISEFRGKGHPIDQIILGFDIDADPHQHVITNDPYCKECVKRSFRKLKKVNDILDQEKINYKILLSGSKGFHIYLLDKDEKVRIGKESEVIYYLELFKGLVDDFRSKYQREWDFHRIFKLPGTVDASTGQKVDIIPITKCNKEQEITKIITEYSLGFNDAIKKIN